MAPIIELTYVLISVTSPYFKTSSQHTSNPPDFQNCWTYKQFFLKVKTYIDTGSTCKGGEDHTTLDYRGAFLSVIFNLHHSLPITK